MRFSGSSRADRADATRTLGAPQQLAFMECRNDDCKGEGPWFNDSGNREWFVYEGDAVTAYDCPECGEAGTQYVY